MISVGSVDPKVVTGYKKEKKNKRDALDVEIDVFPFLFCSKSITEFKEKRLEKGREKERRREGGREEERERKRGAGSLPSAGFLPAEPGPRALFLSRCGLGAFKGF